LTEKLLLFGGAIQLAGDVKGRGERRRVRSDSWTESLQKAAFDDMDKTCARPGFSLNGWHVTEIRFVKIDTR
jgi:hypothetical protein